MFIDNIFSWRPTDDQWWITGFAYDKTYTNIKNQVVIGSVDFSKHEEMYEAFAKEKEKLENPEKMQYVMFDDKNKTVWISICYRNKLCICRSK